MRLRFVYRELESYPVIYENFGWAATCRVPIGLFFLQILLSVDKIWGVPAGGMAERNDRFRPHRNLADFGDRIRRRELPLRPYLPAHIPRMTVVAQAKLPQIILLMINY